MKVQVETVSSIEKRLSVEVESAVVERELKQAYTALASQVKVPGFRPGKVPRRILEQKYRSEVEADVVRRVQLQAFVDAVKEHNVVAVGEPHMSGGKLVEKEPYAFTIRVEVKPEITAKDYKGLAVKKFTGVVTDEQVAEQLERMRASRTELVKVEGRDVAQRGDLAAIDFDALHDGQPFPGSAAKGVTVEITDGSLIEGNLPQLEGATIGVMKEFDYTFPADYRTEVVAGKTVRFHATINELKAKKVPELNDAFAETMGAANLAELKDKLRKDMERAAKNRADADQREEIFARLIEKNTFEVPSSLVEHGVRMMLEAALGSMARSGVDPRMLNLDWPKLQEELRPRADREVRGQLILESVARQESLSVADEDVEKKLEALAEETGLPLSTVRKQYKTQDNLAKLKDRILEDKALEVVKASATFEEPTK